MPHGSEKLKTFENKHILSNIWVSVVKLDVNSKLKKFKNKISLYFNFT